MESSENLTQHFGGFSCFRSVEEGRGRSKGVRREGRKETRKIGKNDRQKAENSQSADIRYIFISLFHTECENLILITAFR